MDREELKKHLAGTLSAPMGGHRLSGGALKKKETSEEPKMLDSTMMKSRPRRSPSLRGATSPPSTPVSTRPAAPPPTLSVPPPSFSGPESVVSPGRISIAELRLLAQQEKEREKNRVSPEKTAETEKTTAKKKTPPSSSGVRRGKKKKAIPRPLANSESDQEEESSGEEQKKATLTPATAAARPSSSVSPRPSSSVSPRPSGGGVRKKKSPSTSSSSSSGVVVALKKELEELKQALEKEKAKCAATDSILGKLLASRGEAACAEAVQKWQEAVRETEALREQMKTVQAGVAVKRKKKKRTTMTKRSESEGSILLPPPEGIRL